MMISIIQKWKQMSCDQLIIINDHNKNDHKRSTRFLNGHGGEWRSYKLTINQSY